MRLDAGAREGFYVLLSPFVRCLGTGFIHRRVSGDSLLHVRLCHPGLELPNTHYRNPTYNTDIEASASDWDV